MLSGNPQRKPVRYCLMCGEPFRRSGSVYDILLSEDVLCSACRNGWVRCRKGSVLDGIRVSSSWIYNDAFSSCLLQFKECGDEALKDVFLQPVRHQLRRRYQGYTLLLMPSSFSRIQQRGFSHLELLFSGLGLPMMSPFRKADDSDQKGKNRAERSAMSSSIFLDPDAVLPRKLLLVDDVITTGATLRGALACLDRHRHVIAAYTCAKTPSERSKSRFFLL